MSSHKPSEGKHINIPSFFKFTSVTFKMLPCARSLLTPSKLCATALFDLCTNQWSQKYLLLRCCWWSSDLTLNTHSWQLQLSPATCTSLHRAPHVCNRARNVCLPFAPITIAPCWYCTFTHAWLQSRINQRQCLAIKKAKCWIIASKLLNQKYTLYYYLLTWEQKIS